MAALVSALDTHCVFRSTDKWPLLEEVFDTAVMREKKCAKLVEV